MDELINAYWEKVFGIDPMNVILDEPIEGLEYRATFSEPIEYRDYAEGTIFYEEEGKFYSPFGYLHINEDGTYDVIVGDSNPSKNKK